MDKLAQFNKERWEELASNGIEYARPWLDLDEATARQRIDPENLLEDVARKDVLLLAGSDSQQSAAFSLLGSRVTVFDLSETQLRSDEETASHYGFEVRTVQGDMRDLSQLETDSYNIVWHAHSLSFVPNATDVFAQVRGVIRNQGIYRLHCTSPFMHGVCEAWNGTGYTVSLPHLDAEVVEEDPRWKFSRPDGEAVQIVGPREFRHTFSTVINGLLQNGSNILGFSEEVGDDADAEPGSWEHFTRIIPPWITFATRYEPERA